MTLFRGGAGTGKSYVLRQRAERRLIEAARRPSCSRRNASKCSTFNGRAHCTGKTVAEFLQRGRRCRKARS